MNLISLLVHLAADDIRDAVFNKFYSIAITK